MAQLLRAVHGATFQEPLTLVNRDGTPTNLTGATLTWMAKGYVDDADVDAVLTATNPGTIVVVDAAAGSIRFAIPAATMAAVPPRSGREWYAWTLEVFVGGVVTRYPDDFQGGPGKLIVSRSVKVAVPS